MKSSIDLGTDGHRIGILGGTFNPIHMGHLVAAEEVGKDFSLDKVILIPANLPPLKDNECLIASEHRLKMVSLAIQSNPRLEVRDLEIRRGGVSYTIDTLGALQDEEAPDTAFFFIIGQDAFRQIGSWRDAQALFGLTHFVVVRRPTLSVDEMLGILEESLTTPKGELNFARTGFDHQVAAEGVEVEPCESRIWLKDIPYFDISSSMIRQRLASGRSIKYLVPDMVEAYILEHLLYAGAAGQEFARS